LDRSLKKILRKELKASHRHEEEEEWMAALMNIKQEETERTSGKEKSIS